MLPEVQDALQGASLTVDTQEGGTCLQILMAVRETASETSRQMELC